MGQPGANPGSAAARGQPILELKFILNDVGIIKALITDGALARYDADNKDAIEQALNKIITDFYVIENST